MHVLASLERTIARLRSQVRYLKEGNVNTSFFSQAGCVSQEEEVYHKINVRRAPSHFSGRETKCVVGIEGLIGTALPRTSTLSLEQFHIQNMDLAEMDIPITEDEVWDTIKTLPADRAPGPDGYTA
jgi:hypothetical protein